MALACAKALPCGLNKYIFDAMVFHRLLLVIYRRPVKVEKEERCAMMEADRAVNLLEHQKEIHARPARQWIVSQQRKVRNLIIGAVMFSRSNPGFGQGSYFVRV